jgi:twinkle protein
MKIYDTLNRQEYWLTLRRNSGQEKTTCPKCSQTRKPSNQKDPCLSWDHASNVGHCHNCHTSFTVFARIQPKKEYRLPQWKNNTELSDKAVQWFESRGISQFVLRRMKITEGPEFMPQDGKEMNTIQFNYFRDEILINVKYRTGSKHFKMFKDAEMIFYNLDGIKESDSVIIVEGEIDALTLIESGYANVVSVPNGASTGSNNLQYLDNCIDYFDNKKEIIIATDNDQPGISLRNELASRLGIERCYKLNLNDCKDANEVLVKHGKHRLVEIIESKEAFPIEGVFTASDLFDELDILYRDGLKSGLKINDPIDSLITFERGRLYTITGIPGHGKSEYLDYWLTKLNIIHGLKFGYFSPENYPLQLHQSKIISKLTGARFAKESLPYDCFVDSVNHISDNYFWVMPPDKFDIDTILEKARYLVLRKGISAFVIDPYNKLEHRQERGESETNYISRFLDTLTNFCHKNNISIFLVAHPRKMQKQKEGGKMEIPNLYDINGSANFFNKTDFGITVYRDFFEKIISVHVQKVKFKHLGEIGSVNYVYNQDSGRFVENGISIETWDNKNWIGSNIPIQEDYRMQPNRDFYHNEKYEAPF